MTIQALDAITITDFIETPDIDRLTTAEIEGTGVFDVLMKATKAHVLEEYESGRIDEDHYSDVYLGALSAVLQQAVTYLLNNQSERKTTAEIGLIRQKIATELAQTSNSIPDDLAFNESTEVQGTIEQQVEQAKNEVIYLEQKIVTELSQTSDVKPVDLGLDTTANITGHSGRKKNVDIQQEFMLKEQVTNTKTEGKLLGQKLVTELAQTADNLGLATTLGYGLNGTTGDIGILGVLKEQVAKISNEASLLEQKTITELAQTSDTDDEGNTFTGLIGEEQKLKIAQTNTAKAEKSLIGQKIVSELSQTGDDLTNVLVADYGYNVDNTLAGLLKETKLKNEKERQLIEQKIVTELGQSSDTKPIDLGYADGTLIDGLIKTKRELDTAQKALLDAQKGVADKEALLIAQKKTSEEGQTADPAGGLIKATIDKLGAEKGLASAKASTESKQQVVLTAQVGKLSSETALLGAKTTTEGVQPSVLAAQIALYGKQSDGFDRDAEQKLAKIVMDAWAVDATVGNNLVNPLTGLDTSILNKAAAGINS